MNILITGGTGFIGRKLGEKLFSHGHNLFVLVREVGNQKLPYPCTLLTWQELENGVANKKIKIDSVINLAGESIAQRWSAKAKKKILDSRVKTTTRLVDIFKNYDLITFISTSAIGYYGNRGDELLTEDSGSGLGFLTEVCKEWESAAAKINDVSNARLVILRFGMVLGEGGALEKMIPPFKKGLGGIIGDGQMWISWIHIDDLVELINQSLTNGFSGIYNAVSPNPIKNIEFSEELASALGKKLFLPIPKLAVKLLFGEMSEIIISSQRVSPKHMLAQGFKYKYERLDSALESIIGNKR